MTAYRWNGNPALSEAALITLRPKRPKRITDPDAALYRPRDVPASCACKWSWKGRHPKHWYRRTPATGCPWHTPRRRAA